MRRNKLWRQFQQNKKVKRRLRYLASILDIFITPTGKRIHDPKWVEMEESSMAHDFQNTGTPCSCEMCAHGKYERKKFKQETIKQLKEVA